MPSKPENEWIMSLNWILAYRFLRRVFENINVLLIEESVSRWTQAHAIFFYLIWFLVDRDKQVGIVFLFL